MKGAGGTEGGVLPFLVGTAMVIAGGYLFLQRVTVSSGFWDFYGRNTFGLTMLPLLVGIGMLFFNGKSKIGWALTGGGALIIFVGIIGNLRVWFAPTTLFDTLMILGLLAGGIGVVARSLRTMPTGDSRRG
jgi:hypothetical protein